MGFGRALSSRALSQSLAQISSRTALLLGGNRGLSAPDAITMLRLPNIGEAMEGLVIKWFLLVGMLGSVVWACVIV